MPASAGARINSPRGNHDQKISPITIKALRQGARQNVENGAVTAGYSADREAVLKLLNDSLATEIVCVLRYRRHHFMARGIHSQAVAAEFLVHSNEEQGHADLLAARIVQLGGALISRPTVLNVGAMPNTSKDRRFRR